jgi:hypothetical protein
MNDGLVEVLDEDDFVARLVVNQLVHELAGDREAQADLLKPLV